jgi:hypothetical protein
MPRVHIVRHSARKIKLLNVRGLLKTRDITAFAVISFFENEYGLAYLLIS